MGQGEAQNFTSLLRCACTIHLGELEQIEGDRRLTAAA
jgi:predicted DNA-binding ribbon-helix-helix protein